VWMESQPMSPAESWPCSRSHDPRPSRPRGSWSHPTAQAGSSRPYRSGRRGTS
jgi:hypothetical protein